MRGCTSNGPSKIVLLAVLAEGGLLLAAVVVGRLVGVHPFYLFEVTAVACLQGVLATVPLLLGLRWCLRTQWQPISRLVAFVEERLRPLFLGCGLGQLALLALVAGVAEEALFRGVLQPGLSRWLPHWGALAGASLLFGVVHFLTVSYAALATLVGLYLGALLILSGNLLVPIVVHVLYDLIALIVLIHLMPGRTTAVVRPP